MYEGMYYHGECACCKYRIYGECEGADYSDNEEFYSCYADYEEETVDYGYDSDSYEPDYYDF